MDVIYGEILPDGTIKSMVGKIGALNHQSAELAMQELSKKTGGRATRDRKGTLSRAEHSHEHGQEHSH